MVKMNKIYKHTQFGYLITILLTIGIILILLLMKIYGFNWIAFIVLVFLILCLLLFSTLTISINNDILEISFGIGLIRKKFLLKDIESCRIVKNPWYYGWGIRLTPYGWLYNVSGFYAVEIVLKTGKRYRIGTNAPNELEKAIQESIEKLKCNE